MSQKMQEIVVIWITFLRSTYPDKILSYKATEIYMELKGRAVCVRPKTVAMSK